MIPAKTLRDLVSGDRARTRLALSANTNTFAYPGKYESIQKVMLHCSAEQEVADINVVTDVDDLIAVIDPKRISAQAIEHLRKYHQAQIKDQFLHTLFQDDFMVMPDNELLTVGTDKHKVFVFNAGSCWEITPSNQLIHVTTIPEQTPTGVHIGSYSSNQSFSFVTHSTYVEAGLEARLFGQRSQDPG